MANFLCPRRLEQILLPVPIHPESLVKSIQRRSNYYGYNKTHIETQIHTGPSTFVSDVLHGTKSEATSIDTGSQVDIQEHGNYKEPKISLTKLSSIIPR